MITLQQLSEEIGSDRLLEILDACGFQARDTYEDGDQELAVIRQQHQSGEFEKQTHPESETQPKSKGKKGGKATKSAALTKADQAAQEGKGSLVRGAQETAKAAVTQARRQGSQLATQANREMVSTFLTGRAQGMSEFADSLNEASEAIAAIGEDIFVSLDADAVDDFLPKSGAFSLL